MLKSAIFSLFPRSVTENQSVTSLTDFLGRTIFVSSDTTHWMLLLCLSHNGDETNYSTLDKKQLLKINRIITF